MIPSLREPHGMAVRSYHTLSCLPLVLLKTYLSFLKTLVVPPTEAFFSFLFPPYQVQLKIL